MKPKDILDRLKRYPIAVICAIIVVVCIVALVLRGGVLDELSAKENELNARLRVIETNAENAKDLAADVEQVESQVAEIEARLFRRDERAINTNFFYAFEDRVDLLISSVSQLAIEDAALGEGGPNALKLHSVIPYDIVVQGSFQEIVKLLYEFHAHDAFIRVSDLQISSGERTGAGELSARMRVLVLAEKTEATQS